MDHATKMMYANKMMSLSLIQDYKSYHSQWPTPRQLILDRLVSMYSEWAHQGQESDPGSTDYDELSAKYCSTNTLDDLQRPYDTVLAVQDLTIKSLDEPLRPCHRVEFLKDVDIRLPNLHSQLQMCIPCRNLRFATSKWLNEFPSTGRGVKQLAGCSTSICSNCLLERITTSLKTGFFSHLGRPTWFKCPTESCHELLDISHVGELGAALRRLGCKDIQEQISIYERAVVLRDALMSLDVSPTPTALRKAASLHEDLISQNIMRSFFDPCFQSSEPDDMGYIPPFEAGRIKMFKIDYGHGSLEIPIFMKFFKRQTASVARQCGGCSQIRCEVDYGSFRNWRRIRKWYPGPWSERVLVFPEKLSSSCDHEIDHCNDCMTLHIKAMVDGGDRDIAHNIMCPSELCRTKLSYEEVKTYADPKTLAKYEKYILLKYVNAEPNFRWCLRCKSGSFYEEEPDKPLDAIECGDCGYEMCYKHQVPWHNGITCDQFEDSGDTKTQIWLKNNTKPCPGPGCGVSISKGDGCFHMTCSICQFEFCWECLADWELIEPQGHGSYRVTQHNEGCFFRRGTRFHPFDLLGSTIEEGLEDYDFESDSEEAESDEEGNEQDSGEEESEE